MNFQVYIVPQNATRMKKIALGKIKTNCIHLVFIMVEAWINDRMDTDHHHAKRVKHEQVKLVTFDDKGSGAVEADLHIAALAFDPEEYLAGKKVLRGLDYLVLEPVFLGFYRYC